MSGRYFVCIPWTDGLRAQRRAEACSRTADSRAPREAVGPRSVPRPSAHSCMLRGVRHRSRRGRAVCIAVGLVTALGLQAQVQVRCARV